MRLIKICVFHVHKLCVCVCVFAYQKNYEKLIQNIETFEELLSNIAFIILFENVCTMYVIVIGELDIGTDFGCVLSCIIHCYFFTALTICEANIPIEKRSINLLLSYKMAAYFNRNKIF